MDDEKRLIPPKAAALLAIGVSGLAGFSVMMRREIGRPLTCMSTVAARAFGLGSILCLCTVSTVAGTVAWSLDVNTLAEFSEKMQRWAPEKRRRIKNFMGLPEKETKPMTTEDEEAFREIDTFLKEAFTEAPKKKKTT